jgi:antitoxin component YwqK of YwqJK toxin-antitoxin module
MKTLNYILSLLMILVSMNISAQEIYLDYNGIYLASNMEPYNGKFMEYYENGNIKGENQFVEGVLNGVTTLYFENGMKSEIRSYKNGRKDGTWLVWNTQGIKVAEANYKNNRKDGKWMIWDNEGKLIYEIYYEKGERNVVQTKYSAL